MMTEEQFIDRICLTCVDVRHAATDESAQKFINDIRGLAVQLAALTQPASPALKLPDAVIPSVHLNSNARSAADSARNGGKIDGWNLCLTEVVRLNAPHTAPIEPICSTGGAEWVGTERVEEIIYRAEMFGHGAGYLPDEVIPIAKELMALRKAFSEPVAFQNNYTGKLWRPEQQPGADQDTDVYTPLYRKPTDHTT